MSLDIVPDLIYYHNLKSQRFRQQYRVGEVLC